MTILFTKVATMSDIKCPFCRQEIKIAGEHTTIMSCFNGDCKGSGLYGEKAFWQELIRTRKALGVAVDALNKIDKQLMTSIEMTCQARNALEQITVLEQKE